MATAGTILVLVSAGLLTKWRTLALLGFMVGTLLMIISTEQRQDRPTMAQCYTREDC